MNIIQIHTDSGKQFETDKKQYYPDKIPANAVGASGVTGLKSKDDMA